MKRSEFRSFHRLRVRWAEVDVQQIVFNAHYLTYFDTAITDYWRRLGLPYQSAMAMLGGDLYVKKASVEYHASARMDDILDVGMKCTRIGNSSLLITGGIFRGDEHLITGELVYVFADPATQTPRPVPQALRELMLGFEAGESTTTTRVGNWSDLGEGASALRHDVFVVEQKIPLELERDPADADATHAVVVNRLGQVLATGRYLSQGDGSVKVGRMAVQHFMRGTGVGREVLRALMAHARAAGFERVVLHAQSSAEGFYRRLGFAVVGQPFEEAGIPHIEMSMRL